MEKEKIILFEFNRNNRHFELRNTSSGNSLNVGTVPRVGEKIILQNTDSIPTVYRVYDVHHNGATGYYEEIDIEIFVIEDCPLQDYLDSEFPDISAGL